MKRYDPTFLRAIRKAAVAAAAAEPRVWAEFRQRRSARALRAWLSSRSSTVWGSLVGAVVLAVLTRTWIEEWSPSPAWDGLFVVLATGVGLMVAIVMSRYPPGPRLAPRGPVSNDAIYRTEVVAPLRLWLLGIGAAAAWLGGLYVAVQSKGAPVGLARALAAVLPLAALQATTVWSAAYMLARMLSERARERYLPTAAAVAGLAALVLFAVARDLLVSPALRVVLLLVPVSWPSQALVLWLQGSGSAALALAGLSVAFSFAGLLFARAGRRNFAELDLRPYAESRVAPTRAAAAIDEDVELSGFLLDGNCWAACNAEGLDWLGLARMTRRERIVRWALRTAAVAKRDPRGWTYGTLACFGALFLARFMVSPGLLHLLLGVALFCIVALPFFKSIAAPVTGQGVGPTTPIFALYPIGIREIARIHAREVLPYRVAATVVASLAVLLVPGGEFNVLVRTSVAALVGGVVLTLQLHLAQPADVLEYARTNLRRQGIRWLESLGVVALLPLVGVAAWGPASPQRLCLVAVGLVATLAGAHLVGHRTLRGRFDWVREPEPPDGFGSPSG